MSLVFAALATSSLAVLLPNGASVEFGAEWVIEKPNIPGAPVSRLHWRDDYGPEMTFQSLPPSAEIGMQQEESWMPVALADAGLRVLKSEIAGGTGAGATTYRRYSCQDSRGRSSIVESSTQVSSSGIFRVTLRYPENSSDAMTAAVGLMKAKFFSGQAELSWVELTPNLKKNAGLDVPEFVQTHQNAMVIASALQGGGSGFICRMGWKSLLITNIHVASASRSLRFRTLSGDVITPDVAYAAIGRDLIAMETENRASNLEMHPSVDDVEVGDPVFVLGNAEGAGVVYPIEGKVAGIGPDLIEVDAPFVPGNSGSPIIHQPTGKVIGVATFITIESNEFGVGGQHIRRFGYRLDRVEGWQTVQWDRFYADRKQLASVKAMTESLFNFASDILDDGLLVEGQHQNPAIRTYVDAWLRNQKARSSSMDAKRTAAQLARFMKSASERDITEAMRTVHYDYFRRELQIDAISRQKVTRMFEKLGES